MFCSTGANFRGEDRENSLTVLIAMRNRNRAVVEVDSVESVCPTQDVLLSVVHGMEQPNEHERSGVGIYLGVANNHG